MHRNPQRCCAIGSERGDLDREILMVEVKGGKQAVVETLPPLKR